MTQYGSGQYAGYTPPPPPKRGTSPWLWVLLGCGGLTVLVFGGCIATIGYFGSRMKTAMNAPYDSVAAEKALGDVPKYPGAALNIEMSKAMRVVIDLEKMALQADSVSELAYQCPDDFIKVSAWYDEQLTKAGYKSMPSRSQMYMFTKGDTIVGIQDMKGKANGNGFLILKAVGVKRK